MSPSTAHHQHDSVVAEHELHNITVILSVCMEMISFAKQSLDPELTFHWRHLK